MRGDGSRVDQEFVSGKKISIPFVLAGTIVDIIDNIENEIATTKQIWKALYELNLCDIISNGIPQTTRMCLELNQIGILDRFYDNNNQVHWKLRDSESTKQLQQYVNGEYRTQKQILLDVLNGNHGCSKLTQSLQDKIQDTIWDIIMYFLEELERVIDFLSLIDIVCDDLN